MKTSSFLSAAMLLCVTVSTGQAQIQPGASADVILQLKLTRTEPGLVTRDEPGAVIRG